MKTFNTFKDELLDYLKKYPQIPGRFIAVRRQVFTKSDQIEDMRQYVNQELINALSYYSYCPILKLSTSDCLVLLDIHDGYKDNLDYTSHVIYEYDADSDKVKEIEIEKILVDPDFSLTTEELEKIILDLSTLRPIFEIGDVVMDRQEKKRWVITFIYTPWADNMLYKGAYKRYKLDFPNENFFYALRLLRGKRERIAPEGLLTRVIPIKHQ